MTLWFNTDEEEERDRKHELFPNVITLSEAFYRKSTSTGSRQRERSSRPFLMQLEH
jgi:hypothetical protein